MDDHRSRAPHAHGAKPYLLAVTFVSCTTSSP
jgi:hypothetical protein